jgi:aryl-alcohol dehydrogenase-like predicted oxidoreductase
VSHQPEYSLLDRRIEPDLVPLCAKEGIGLIVYSPLAQGVLTGKYRRGIPEGTRATTKFKMFMDKWLKPEQLAKVKVLEKVARRKKKTPAQIALAWILGEEAVSSAIIGATTVKQLEENLKAVKVKLSASDREELDKAFPRTGDPL